MTAGAGNRLVGKVRGSDFPPEAQALVEVGDAAGLDFERILALRPDLVLAWGSGNRIHLVENGRYVVPSISCQLVRWSDRIHFPDNWDADS